MKLTDRKSHYNLYKIDKHRYLLEVSPGRLNYYNKTENKWRPINPSLVLQKDKTITTNDTPYNISIFPDRDGYRIYPDKTKPDIYVDFYLPEYLYKDKQIIIDGNKITYLGEGYKTNIITTNSRIIFQLEVDNEEVFKIIPKTLALTMKTYGTILQDDGFFSDINIRLVNTITDDIGNSRTLKYSYDKNTNTLSIDIDTTDLVYPIIVDPTVDINPGAGGNDGWVYGRASTYSTAHDTAYTSDSTSTTLRVGQLYGKGYYFVNRIFLKFDTTTIPSTATITSAKLRLYGQADYSVTDFYIRLQKWTGDTPIDTGDYNQFDGTNYDDGNFYTSSWSTSGYNDITISNYNLITKAGYTKICVRSSRDISSTTPSGEEYVFIYAYEQGTGYYPVLHIEYTTGVEEANNPGDIALDTTKSYDGDELYVDTFDWDNLDSRMRTVS